MNILSAAHNLRVKAGVDFSLSLFQNTFGLGNYVLIGLSSVLTKRYFDDPTRIDFEAVIEEVAQGDAVCMDAFST